MRLGGEGTVTGWAGCRLANAAYIDGLGHDNATRQPVPLLVPPTSRLRNLDGSTVSREPYERDAVVAMDMMAAAVQVSIAEMREYLSRRPRWRRASRVA